MLDVLARLSHPESAAGEDLRAGQRLVRHARVQRQAQAPWAMSAAYSEPDDQSDREPGDQQEELFSEAVFDGPLEAELDATEGPLPPRRVRQPGRPNKRSSGPRR